MTPHERTAQMQNLLSFLLVGSFISVLPLLIFKDIPGANKDLITYMLGQLSGMATMALGFYFTMKVGQDALDAKRSETSGKLADAVTAALTSPTDKAAKAAGAVADAAQEAADEIREPKP